MTVEESSGSRSYHWASAGRPPVNRKILYNTTNEGPCCNTGARRRHNSLSFESQSQNRRFSSSSLCSNIETLCTDPSTSFSLIAKAKPEGGRNKTNVEAEAAKRIQRYLHRNLFSTPITSPTGYSSLYNKLKRPHSRSSDKNKKTYCKKPRSLRSSAQSESSRSLSEPGKLNGPRGSASSQRKDETSQSVRKTDTLPDNNSLINVINSVENDIHSDLLREIFPVRQHIHIYLPEDNELCEPFSVF